MGIAVYIQGEPPDVPHTQVERIYQGETVEVDIGIVEVIDWLNANRMPTTSCCQGDFEHYIDGSVGFIYESDAQKFFDYVREVWRGTSFKNDELSCIELCSGYNPELDRFGYGINFDCRIIPDLVNFLKTVNPDCEQSDDIYFPSSARVGEPVKATVVAVVKPQPFDLELDD